MCSIGAITSSLVSSSISSLTTVPTSPVTSPSLSTIFGSSSVAVSSPVVSSPTSVSSSFEVSTATSTVISSTSPIKSSSGSVTASSSVLLSSTSASSSVRTSASSSVAVSSTSSVKVSSSRPVVSPTPSSTMASSGLSTFTTVASSTPSIPSSTPIAGGNVLSTVLVIARDTYSADVASSGLNGYGIPFTTLIVPQSGVQLPALNSSSGGNFGGLVVASEVSYNFGGTTGYQSALTADQWNQLYAYQLEYGVRMVQYDVYPGPNYGATALGGCCATGVEQDISFTDTSDFPTAGLRTGAGVSTQGLWHYPATISNTTTTKEIAQFAVNGQFGSASTAAVINNFGGRQQMVFFTSFDTTWSPASNYLQHAWITWLTRGIHAGYRRVNLNTQIDDMFLETDIYQPNGTTFRIRAADMDGIKAWVPSINAKLNGGSQYFVEVGFNGNGNIEYSANVNSGLCNGGAIEYSNIPDTPLEFQKPLGTGTDMWPSTPTTYDWSIACANLDPLKQWWVTPANRDAFGTISHTFSHEEQNNATYSDVYKEISFNIAWLKQVTISDSPLFTSNGIIPPAITGLHNGDALRAWMENGITNCVGDNTRPVLLNPQNSMWPLITTVAANGHAGMQVNPRWATRIYYNCDTPDCTTQEWIATSAGSGDFYALLNTEKADTMRHLFGLHREPYMFHQANLRNTDASSITINGVSSKMSIFQAWVETQVQEFVRLVTWPVITLKQADMSDQFARRMARDACGYGLSYTISNGQIAGVTVTANGNTCNTAIPITLPVAPTSTNGFPTEQIGSDPLTVWVTLSGSPVSFTLSKSIAL